MWLLTTDRARLVYFPQPPKRYAILSHVWQKGRPGTTESLEQSFRDLKAIEERCRSTGVDPRMYLSQKISRCCAWAASHGFKYVWIDTCCINKDSSSELSEAINSMFNWYSNATICYAYLQDVSIRDDPSATNSTFRRSRWFTRGWTLQELIAPRDVIFLSREWVPLTSKRATPQLLHSITGIDEEVLLCEQPFTSIPAAKRMSWAATRRTSRIEDMAYCLMGLFKVKMPTIYGEGRTAFLRLQEEIMRRTPDHSLLVWGPSLSLTQAVMGSRPDKDRLNAYPSPHDRNYIQQSLLYAQSPSDFAKSPDIANLSLDAFKTTHILDEARVPTLTPTNYGVQALLPIIRFPNSCDVALLPCQSKGATIGLIVRNQGASGPWALGKRIIPQAADTFWDKFRLSSSPPYRWSILSLHLDKTGRQLPACNHVALARYVLVPGDRIFGFETRAEPDWETIYLAYSLDHVTMQKERSWSTLSLFKPTIVARRYRVFLPPWVPTRLRAHGFSLVSPANERMPARELHEGSDAFVVAFEDALANERFAIHLKAFPYTKVPSATRVLCTVRFETQSPPLSMINGGVAPGINNGDFIDSWYGTGRTFTNNITSLQLNFLRMGDMEVNQTKLDECHVYQMDILLPMKRVSVSGL
ncbi:heterokaryon incompatibility protein-domain-containing protein [Cerioporus squamosus]|nr:heterokaryon incompatibility protein-domain-containing protein [Cerioporus squamosus]